MQRRWRDDAERSACRLALRLWRRCDAVKHAERPADASESGLEVLALLSEHREAVGVHRLRNADMGEHLLERGVMLDQGLAFADSAREDIPRRVILADDDRLAGVLRAPQTERRRVVLHKLAEHSLLPPAQLRFLLAFDRKELVQEPVEMRLSSSSA